MSSYIKINIYLGLFFGGEHIKRMNFTFIEGVTSTYQKFLFLPSILISNSSTNACKICFLSGGNNLINTYLWSTHYCNAIIISLFLSKLRILLRIGVLFESSAFYQFCEFVYTLSRTGRVKHVRTIYSFSRVNSGQFELSLIVLELTLMVGGLCPHFFQTPIFSWQNGSGGPKFRDFSRRCGHFQPHPHSVYIHKPPTIRVKKWNIKWLKISTNLVLHKFISKTMKIVIVIFIFPKTEHLSTFIKMVKK